MNTTAEYLLNKYGPLLTRENVVEIFRYKNEASFNTAVSAGRIPGLHKTGVNDLFHYADVAAAIDGLAVFAICPSARVPTNAAKPKKRRT